MKKLKDVLRPSFIALTSALLVAFGLAVKPLAAITIPSTAQVIQNIQKLSGWQTCFGSCTATPMAVFSMTQGITNPSVSGSSAKFSLLPGTKTWGAALWFKTLGGGHNNATHFVLDLNYYVDNPAVDQAMEFYVTQNANGIRYNFGAQCDLAGAHAWRMWDNIGKRWVGSPVTCPTPLAKTWYHLTLEFQHQPGGELLWTAVSVNGKRSLVNLGMQHTPGSTNGLDIAYQSDANHVGAPFSVWLDKVSLTFW